jgi:hypothetical protein
MSSRIAGYIFGLVFGFTGTSAIIGGLDHQGHNYVVTMIAIALLALGAMIGNGRQT